MCCSLCSSKDGRITLNGVQAAHEADGDVKSLSADNQTAAGGQDDVGFWSEPSPKIDEETETALMSVQ